MQKINKSTNLSNSSALKINNSQTKNIFLNSSGPISDIVLSPEHGGPILCLDATPEIVVTGSTDHGLRVYSTQTGKQIKELFNKNFGHTEYVTCVKILSDKRIISGGMDSNICVWEPNGVRCKFITENTGSISKIIINENESLIMSSSYDSSVRVFDTNSLQSLCVLSGVHKGPVTEIEWKNSLCVSGSKDGSVAIWDLNQEKCIKSAKMHGGLIKNIKFFTMGENNQNNTSDNLIITAGTNDGMINVIDMRTNKPIHGGSINFLGTNSDNKIITGSSDKTVKIFDIVNNFGEIGNLKTTDSVVCGEILNSFLAIGCADGNLISYNLDNLDCLYGYGCDNKGSINTLKILPEMNRIITAGDCGQGMQVLF